jgi:hypothetical protein
MRGRKRALAILGISTAICSLCGTTALAGHGAVSDILSFRNVYLPDAPVCQEVAAGLDQVTDRAVKDGYPIKVAVIASEADVSGADGYAGPRTTRGSWEASSASTTPEGPAPRPGTHF